MLYGACVSEPKLTLKLNTPVILVDAADRRVTSVTARVLGAETDLIISADATGDGLLAACAGCPVRRGSESRSEFGELHAPQIGRRDDEMGNSLHFKTKDVSRPVEFRAPEWIVRHTDRSYFWDQGRKLKDTRGGFWWIELAKPLDTIDDAEELRHELARHVLGIWDWMKNHDPKTKDACRNLALDWIGQIPGKRESRRIEGAYFMTENDIQECRSFEDDIAFGGWFLDLYTPGGLLAQHLEARSKESYSPYGQKAAAGYVGPYGIPYRSLVPRGCSNLLLAGRSLSMTHAAMGTIRVMNTLALVCQAVGTVAARAVECGRIPADLDAADLRAVQQRLLRDDTFLLRTSANDARDLARRTRVSAGSEELLSGADPNTEWESGDVGIWSDQVDPRITDRLDSVHAQLIPVSGAVARVSLLLMNDSEQTVSVPLRLTVAEHIWDYRAGGAGGIGQTSIEVSLGTAWYS